MPAIVSNAKLGIPRLHHSLRLPDIVIPTGRCLSAGGAGFARSPAKAASGAWQGRCVARRGGAVRVFALLSGAAVSAGAD